MIYFQSISENGPPEDYLSSRLKKFLTAFPQEQHAGMLRSFAAPNTGGVLPHFAPVGELDGATEAVAAAKSVVEEFFPLAASEQLEDEELCALLSERTTLDDSPLYLRQVTNRARFVVEVPNWRIKAGSVIASPELKVEHPPEIEEPAAESAAAVPVWALALAKQLGLKLLEAAGSAVWDVVRKEVLGQTDLPSYYKEVYEELRRIVAFEFQQHYIKEVEDLAKKFDMTMVHYNNMGRSLEDFIIVKNTSFDFVIKSNSLNNPGAFHYAEATVLHIMMLQEEYKRLVESGRGNLEQARKYISSMASQFAGNVTIKHNILLTERMATISTEPYQYFSATWNSGPGRLIGGVREGAHRDDGFRGEGPMGPIQNMFEDKTNEFRNSMWFNWSREIGRPGHSWNWVNGNLQRYRQHIHTETARELHPLLEVAERLRRLAAKPV